MRYKSVLEIFETSEKRYPDKVMIQDENNKLTYKDLLDKSQKIGIAINKVLYGKTKTPIMIFIDKGCDCLAAMLGVLYSGNVYVPMDVKTPIDRLNSISKILESDYLIVSDKEFGIVSDMGYEGHVYNINFLAENFDICDAKILEQIQNEIIDTDLMYILFTSGSTGIPKGVAIQYRSVIDYIDAFVETVKINEDDIFGNQTPFFADMSLKDIYMTMAVGATICVIPQKYFMSPVKLLNYLEINQVTMLAWVPTAYQIVSRFDALSKTRPSSIKKLIFSGESMPISVYRYWSEKYPDAVWIQQYGPTEITGACTSYTLEKKYCDGDTIPLGKPFKNTGIILIDEEEKLITPKESEKIGEICVFGTCLAAGYYNNYEKTKEVFVQNPFVTTHEEKMYRTGDLGKYDIDGNLIFVSRKDYQIKHVGKRIELGEIEAAITSIEKVKICCCTHNKKKDELVLYYVGDIEKNDIRLQAQEKLPKYMIPTAIYKLIDLPLLSNGKLNRKQMEEWANQ